MFTPWGTQSVGVFPASGTAVSIKSDDPSDPADPADPGRGRARAAPRPARALLALGRAGRPAADDVQDRLPALLADGAEAAAKRSRQLGRVLHPLAVAAEASHDLLVVGGGRELAQREGSGGGCPAVGVHLARGALDGLPR